MNKNTRLHCEFVKSSARDCFLNDSMDDFLADTEDLTRGNQRAIKNNGDDKREEVYQSSEAYLKNLQARLFPSKKAYKK